MRTERPRCRGHDARAHQDRVGRVLVLCGGCDELSSYPHQSALIEVRVRRAYAVATLAYPVAAASRCGPTHVPGGSDGKLASSPSMMPCTRLSHNLSDFSLGPTRPSTISKVSPCTSDQQVRMAPAILRALRAAPSIGWPSAPSVMA